MADTTRKVTIEVDIKHQAMLKDLINQLEMAAKKAPQAARATQQLTKSMKQTQIQARKGGRVLQNFSFQMQDIIVQTSGGTSVMRSLSQQLPQMLIGFGALGAVVGVVAAGLPILIQMFWDAEEVTVELSDSLDTLNTALSSMGTFTSGLDFNQWNKSWNEATASVRETELALLEFRVTAAQGNLLTAISAGAKEVEGDLTALQTPLAWISDWFYGIDNSAEALKDINLTESLGIDRATVDNIQSIYEEFRSGRQTAEEMRLTMLALGKDITDATPEFYALVEQMNNLAVATEKLAQARKQAGAAGAGGLLPVTGGKKPKGKNANQTKDLFGPGREQFKIQKEALAETQRLYAALYPEAIKYQQAVLDLNAAKEQGIISEERYNQELRDSKTAYETAIEGTSLATEATDIFLATFDTAVNGVAQGTQSMSEAFENMTKAILLQVGKLLAITAIGNSLKGSGGFLGQVGAALLAEKGAVVSGGRHLTAYAKGGVVNSPTVFPMSGGGSGSFGLMGESGSEAVLPLSRMSNGNLGVESSGMNVVINNNASGVEVRPRQTEDGLTIDVVMSAVSQAVRRGGNEVSESFEASYALNRGRAVYGN